MQKTIFLFLALLTASLQPAKAQSPAVESSNKKELYNSANLVFGLSQITLRGFNIEGNVLYKRFAFDYSHGVSLDMAGATLVGDEADQGLAVHIPWTTGFGVGYRFNEWLNLRVEPKWHRYELFYDGDVQNAANEIQGYNTFTLGLGLYANLRPFKNKNNALQGIMIAPSVRWWPEVSTTLDEGQFTYLNRETERMEVHQSREVGIANTPFLVNISIGYGIGFKNRKQ